MSEPPIRLLHESLIASAARTPHKTALAVGDARYSYAELLDTALRLAAALRARGVQRGDRVAIFMENGFHCAVSVYAALFAGAAFMLINPQTRHEKLAYMLDDSEAVCLLTEESLAAAFVPALAGVPALHFTICSGQLPEPALGLETWSEALASAAPLAEQDDTIALDLAALIYTSGSTGRPKGVMMTHQAMVFTSESLIQYLRLSAEDRILNVLPLAFDYGLYQLLMSVRLGSTLVLERTFAYPGTILQRIRERDVTVFPGVPTLYAMLISLHRTKPFALPSVRRITNTAAALPPSAIPELRRIFPSALIFKMYGLTECKRVCYLEPEELDARPDSVGRAIPGTEAFVLSNDGTRAAPGETGILHVRGPHVMLGYWKLPERSAEMLKPGPQPGELMLCTQDQFRMDADGYLYFVGRTDEIIKTRGEKVSPVEVEQTLHTLSGVREAAVIGVPDELLGQALRAFVVVEPGVELSDKDIKRHCSALLENFMVPRDVVFLSELPKTDNGKVRKQSLAELA